jgi:hypothetical protein
MKGNGMGTRKRSTISNTRKEGIFHESIREYSAELVVIREGDPWFSYPLSTNLADFIEMMGPLTMLRHEKNGDEASQDAGAEGLTASEAQRYLKRYRKHVQLLICSGGGNVILDENLPSLLIGGSACMSWRECINDDVLAARPTEVREAPHLAIP